MNHGKGGREFCCLKGVRERRVAQRVGESVAQCSTMGGKELSCPKGGRE